MTGLSPYGEATVLASILTTVYVSLHSADPGPTGANEIAGNAYARQGPTTFANSGSNPTVAANTAIVAYPTATADWGNVGFFGLWTALTGGSFEGSGALDAVRDVLSGDQVRFLAGALTTSAD